MAIQLELKFYLYYLTLYNKNLVDYSYISYGLNDSMSLVTVILNLPPMEKLYGVRIDRTELVEIKYCFEKV